MCVMPLGPQQVPGSAKLLPEGFRLAGPFMTGWRAFELLDLWDRSCLLDAT
jgi:hypothetical protein